jgi:hypothetical protein
MRATRFAQLICFELVSVFTPRGDDDYEAPHYAVFSSIRKAYGVACENQQSN